MACQRILPVSLSSLLGLLHSFPALLFAPLRLLLVPLIFRPQMGGEESASV